MPIKTKKLKITDNWEAQMNQYVNVDFKDRPNTVLETVNNLLKPHKLKIEILDCNDDQFYFNIKKIKICLKNQEKNIRNGKKKEKKQVHSKNL